MLPSFAKTIVPVCRIEVRKPVVLLDRRRRVFVSEADVGRQLRRDAVVVLNEVELHVLPLVHDGVARQRQLGRQAQQQIADRPVREPVLEVHAPDGGVQIVDAGLTCRNSAPNLMKCAPRFRLNVARGFHDRGVWNCGVEVCRPTASNPWMFTLGTPPTIAGSFGTFRKPISAAPSMPKFGG